MFKILMLKVLKFDHESAKKKKQDEDFFDDI